jgi:hypothetical protein
MKSKVSPDARLVFYGSENLDILSVRPFYSRYYVVEVFVHNFGEQRIRQLIKYMSTNTVQFIFYQSRFKEFMRFKEMEKVQSFSGYRPDKRVLLEYVMDRLRCGISDTAYKLLAKRLLGNYYLLDSCLEKLNALEVSKITDKHVIRIVPNLNMISFRQMMIYLVERTHRERIFELLEDYRYASRFVFDTLIDEMNIIISAAKKCERENRQLEDVVVSHSMSELLWILWMLETYKKKGNFYMFVCIYKIYIRRDNDYVAADEIEALSG